MSNSNKWYETFFEGLYSTVLDGQFDRAETKNQAKTIKRILKLRKGQSILDCPCGMGRVTFELAKLGLNVTGADLTSSYLRRAKKIAKTSETDIPYIRCDMRKIPFEKEFDAVVNWFTSFGYFDEKGNLQAAKAAFNVLKPGGKYLIETMNKSWVLPRFKTKITKEINGVYIKKRAQMNSNGKRILDNWTMSKGNKIEKRKFSIRIYNGTELRSLLHQTGFRDIKLYGSSSLGALPSRLTRHSCRLIAIGTRPK